MNKPEPYAEMTCGVTWGISHIHFGEHCCPQVLGVHAGSHTCNQCDAELPLDAVHAPLKVSTPLPAVVQRYRADYDGDDGLSPHPDGDYVKEQRAELDASNVQPLGQTLNRHLDDD